MFRVWGMDTNIPVYVTRPSAKGETGVFTLSAWMPLLAMMLIWLNIVVWGCLGLYWAFAILV